MDKAKLIALQASLLRGGLCAVWVVAFIFGFLAMIPALSGVDDDSNLWAFKVIVYFLIGITALSVHVHLIGKANPKDDNETFY